MLTVLYHYIDESYKADADYWYCNIGGAMIAPARAVEVELALSECIYTRLNWRPDARENQEFKYSDFFRNIADDEKLELCEALCRIAAELDVSFHISHAKCRKDRLQFAAKAMGGEQSAIQYFAFTNIPWHLALYSKKRPIQIIVDLGLSRSFKPLYDMYVSHARGLVTAKSMGVDDGSITLPNYRNLPVPLFIDSKDSRIMQLSDLITGLSLASEIGEAASGFKSQLLAATSCLKESIVVQRVEWNAKS